MPWYAFDAVDDALDATRNFLLPFSWGRWLRLAVIVFFLGGGSGLNGVTNVPSSFPSDGGPTPGPGPAPDPAPGPSPDVWTSLSELTGLSPDALVALGAALLVGVVLYVVVAVVASSVMPFVLVDALRTNEVRVRGPFKRRFWKGMRFLLFQIGVGLLVVAPFALGVLLFALAAPNAAAFDSFLAGFGLAGFLGLLAVALVAFVVLGLLLGFTEQFVVPVMIATDSGVLSGWRQFWPTLRSEWKQFLVYLVVRFVLQLGVGIATFVVGGILAAVVVVGALLVGLVVAGAFGGLNAALGSVAGVVALVVLGVLTLLALLAVSLPIKIVVQSYFTAYELSVLGAADDRFALLPPRPGQGDDESTDPTGWDGDDGDGGDDSENGRPSTSGGDGPVFTDGADGADGAADDRFVWGDDTTAS
ncbi:hypothetical protein SAMN04487948_10462 [Halogranum amylolyticum]|uniref:Uncharacterized protein n=1 Tax=Halogranum amylolyticum TaxID=660520 RepID=A0A1H8RJ75_9EURY|nr:hypothetical protein [Halogranum amylolyticum]SEO66589.1 hypothetical protein SAMN04487948_10462 [Halogranum amylolyticum]